MESHPHLLVIQLWQLPYKMALMAMDQFYPEPKLSRHMILELGLRIKSIHPHLGHFVGQLPELDD